MRRRIRITREDINDWGPSDGCPGCISITRGGHTKPHTERCKVRIEKALERVNAKRVTRYEQRLAESVEEKLNQSSTHPAKRQTDDENEPEPPVKTARTYTTTSQEPSSSTSQ